MKLQRPEFGSGVPLHAQIHALVRAEILDGLFIGADAFPGEIELAERFGVSVITSRTVLRRLDAEGLIDRGRGRRSRARFAPEPVGPSHKAARPINFSEHYAYTILRIGETVAPWQACRTFGLPPGSIMWECVRLRSLDGNPHSVTVSIQPVELGRQHDIGQIPDVPMPELLARAGHPVVRLDRSVGVARPSVEIGAALGVTVWEKLLLVTIEQYSFDDRPAEWTRFYYHPEQDLPLETVVREAT